MREVKWNKSLFGMQLFENPNLVVFDRTEQKRTHKFKFINWIFAKLYGYQNVYKPDPNYYVTGGKIIGHPETLKKMVEAMQKQNNETGSIRAKVNPSDWRGIVGNAGGNQ